MSDLTPCTLERKILPKVWGGRALEDVLGLELPPGEAVGETWELFDRPDGSSQIRGSDRTLRDLMTDDARGLLGAGVRPTSQGYFPLLVKYIDAAQRLSVQVHPDDDAARSAGDSGKSEAWVVLGTGEGAKIICGFKDGVTWEQFAAVAATQEVEGLLHSFTPQVGDSIYVPAGTVHAIGPGVVVYEVQQNSDITYRLYDWGRPRPTHVEQALEVTRVGVSERQRSAPEANGEWLFRNEHFTTRRVRIGSPATLGSEGTFKVLSVVEGQGTLGWHSGGREAPLILRRGDTVLIPAVIEVCFLSPIGNLELLVSGPGEEH
jgi:mannose-6-phosphate isomerase